MLQKPRPFLASSLFFSLMLGSEYETLATTPCHGCLPAAMLSVIILIDSNVLDSEPPNSVISLVSSLSHGVISLEQKNNYKMGLERKLGS